MNVREFKTSPENFEDLVGLDVPVLFLVFNRPKQTAEVFNAIRSARPVRLYVAADGPRPHKSAEEEKVAEVRRIVEDVDWPCEVKLLFREENLGCKYAVSSAISWFFAHEECGIILEDDCLPHPDFFHYCRWALSTYRDDKRVWQINGNNFAADQALYPSEVGFVSLPQPWGWASWADRWAYYDNNIFRLQHQLDKTEWQLSGMARINKTAHVNALRNGLDTWDYQWQLTVLQHHGLVVSPRSNLISNLGDGSDATHTQQDERVRLPTTEFEFPAKPIAPRLSRGLNAWHERMMGLRGFRRTLRSLAAQTTYAVKDFAKDGLRRLLFRHDKPIVVASTGRSGSTLLTDTIVEALVRERFGRHPNVLKRILSKLAYEFVPDLGKVRFSRAPIIKTHSMFDPKFEDDGRLIFIFGDPSDAAMSVKGMWEKEGITWVEEHIAHLSGKGSPHQLLHDDVLNYDAQLDSWSSAQSAYKVHYDDLWAVEGDLSDFCGVELRLPARRTRAARDLPSDANVDMFDALHERSEVFRLKSVQARRPQLTGAPLPEGLTKT